MALKSLLLTPVLTALSALMVLAIVQLASGGHAGTWLGVLLAAAPLPVFVGALMLRGTVARTAARLPMLRWTGVAGAALTLAMTLMTDGPFWPAAVAAIAAAAFLWYEFHYSDLARQPSSVLRQGGKLPNIRLEGLDGEVVETDTLRGAPSLFLFYRGNWCPLCVAQVREIAALYQRLADQGVRVFLVSPQSHEQSEKLAEKFAAPMTFLVDPDGAAAQALEIHAPDGLPLGLTLFGFAGDTVLPTVIATDADGTIRFLDQTDNYRVRPEPETFLEIFAA